MRFYEIYGLDVIIEQRKQVAELVNSLRTNIKEEIEQDQEYAAAFIVAAVGSTIIESELVIGNYYWPISATFNLLKKVVSLHTVMYPVKYVGVAGSRLEFKLDSCIKPIFFPSDEFLDSNEHRFIYESKDILDGIIVYFSTKFDNTEWIVRTTGINRTGMMVPITFESE